MKIEVTNNVGGTYPLLKELPAGSCAWIQSTDDSHSSFDVLVMVINVEGSKSYVALSNGYSRPPGNCFMNYPAIPVSVKVVGDNQYGRR